MQLKQYLHTTFPNLTLQPSLYAQTDIGICFEFAKGIYQFTEDHRLNLKMFNIVYSQALSIFHDLFSDQDDIFLVTNLYQDTEYKKVGRIKVYHRFLKNKDLRFQLKQESVPFMFDEDDEADSTYTSQFHLKCKKKDLHYVKLIQACCNEDFPLKPRLEKKKNLYYPDVFFINTTKNVIFFIYDDRGCQVIANNKETLRPLYEKYTDLIDEYVKEEVDQLFT